MSRHRDENTTSETPQPPRETAPPPPHPARGDADAGTSATSAKTDPEKIRLEVRTMGREAGDPVLFLHCLGADLRQFLPQQMALSSAKRTVACSLRGHGQSTAPAHPTVEDYRPAQLATDVVTLLGQLDIRRAHVVGHGLGGLVGLQLLRTAPDIPASLTLSGVSATFGRSLGKQAVLRLGLWLGGPEAGIAMAAGRPGADGVGEREVELLEDMADRASPEAIQLVLRALRRYDYRPELRATRIPIQILRAEKDPRINARLGPTLEALAEHPHFRLKELPDCGHWANLEAPAKFSRALREFYHELGELSDAGLQPVTAPPPKPPRARLSTLVFESPS